MLFTFMYVFCMIFVKVSIHVGTRICRLLYTNDIAKYYTNTPCSVDFISPRWLKHRIDRGGINNCFIVWLNNLKYQKRLLESTKRYLVGYFCIQLNCKTQSKVIRGVSFVCIMELFVWWVGRSGLCMNYPTLLFFYIHIP